MCWHRKAWLRSYKPRIKGTVNSPEFNIILFLIPTQINSINYDSAQVKNVNKTKFHHVLITKVLSFDCFRENPVARCFPSLYTFIVYHFFIKNSAFWLVTLHIQSYTWPLSCRSLIKVLQIPSHSLKLQSHYTLHHLLKSLVCFQNICESVIPGRLRNLYQQL